MGRLRKNWSKSIRRDVLLRCFFCCTAPGCTNSACDLHHVELHSKGGSDGLDNLIGLCKECHRWVHENPDHLDEAREWLANQIEHCPVRLDNILRTTLFEEIVRASESENIYGFNSNQVYNSSSWNTYEVFLKATLKYQKSIGAYRSKLTAVILFEMTNLYRKRPGRLNYRSALRFLKLLKALYPQLSDNKGIQWLKPKILYQEGDLAFFNSSTSNSTLSLFDESARIEMKNGNGLGSAISKARGQHILKNRGTDIIPLLIGKREELSRYTSSGAMRWVDFNLPIQLAKIHIANEQWSAAMDLISTTSTPLEIKKDMVHLDYPDILFIKGLCYCKTGALDDSLELLEKARRSSWTYGSFRLRLEVLAVLGDIHYTLGEFDKACGMYKEIVLNRYFVRDIKPINHAKMRLTQIDDDTKSGITIFNPYSL